MTHSIVLYLYVDKLRRKMLMLCLSVDNVLITRCLHHALYVLLS